MLPYCLIFRKNTYSKKLETPETEMGKFCFFLGVTRVTLKLQFIKKKNRSLWVVGVIRFQNSVE